MSAATFPSLKILGQELHHSFVPITAVNNRDTNSTDNGKADPGTNKTISKSTIAAIIIALVLGYLAAAALAIFLIKRKRSKRKDSAAKAEKSSQLEDINPFQKAEMDGSGKPPPEELDSVPRLKSPAEAHDSSLIEKEGDGVAAEVPGGGAGVEMDAGDAHTGAERGSKPVEMDVGTFGK